MFSGNLTVLTEKDLDQILEIEAESFLQPWNRNMFLDELSSDNGQGYVVREDPVINNKNPVAFIVFRLIADEMHIFKIAVAQKWRQHKIGSWLLKKSFDIAVENHVSKILLEVRYSNNPAIILYNRLGFQIVGRRPYYYSVPSYRLTGEDALVMMKKIKGV